MIFCCSCSAGATSFVKSISYQGNHATQASVMNREIYIVPGDVYNEAAVEKSRQAIMDLGLFKKVHYYIEENYSVTDTDTDVDADVEAVDSYIEIIFVVKEKYYFYVLPKIKLDDNEVFYGAQLTWDNAWGLNHSLKARYENRGSTAGVDERKNSLKYAWPNINGGTYNLDFQLQSSNAVDEADENNLVDRQDETFQIGVSRWLNEQGRNKGWFMGASVLYQQRFNDVLSGDLLSESIEATALGISAGYKNLKEYEYNRGGKSFSYALDWSDESIGSGSEYVRYKLAYRSYYRLDNSPYKNINVQTQFGHSNNKILGKYAFSLGSRTDLRGYENSRFNGNVMLLVNVEYMFPHPRHPIVRYVYFADIGNAYENSRDILHEPLNVGAGVGMRWKVRSLVNIDLRVDLGYGFTDDDYRFSFGTRHAF
ncbi:hypothetical protein MNBD_GAMMA10-1711 [hydrothermal vent metagenome]|uniref:POTRA domain-containing protein n=1 Tax=hydrothermal vent metagenome TaxID=652676 RepID=A0A3B0XQG2_9ZZZZ